MVKAGLIRLLGNQKIVENNKVLHSSLEECLSSLALDSKRGRNRSRESPSLLETCPLSTSPPTPSMT